MFPWTSSATVTEFVRRKKNWPHQWCARVLHSFCLPRLRVDWNARGFLVFTRWADGQVGWISAQPHWTLYQRESRLPYLQRGFQLASTKPRSMSPRCLGGCSWFLFITMQFLLKQPSVGGCPACVCFMSCSLTNRCCGRDAGPQNGTTLWISLPIASVAAFSFILCFRSLVRRATRAYRGEQPNDLKQKVE